MQYLMLIVKAGGLNTDFCDGLNKCRTARTNASEPKLERMQRVLEQMLYYEDIKVRSKRWW